VAGPRGSQWERPDCARACPPLRCARLAALTRRGAVGNAGAAEPSVQGEHAGACSAPCACPGIEFDTGTGWQAAVQWSSARPMPAVPTARATLVLDIFEDEPPVPPAFSQIAAAATSAATSRTLQRGTVRLEALPVPYYVPDASCCLPPLAGDAGFTSSAIGKPATRQSSGLSDAGCEPVRVAPWSAVVPTAHSLCSLRPRSPGTV